MAMIPFFTMCALKGANRVGILAKSLHKYYISNKSTSSNFDPDRIKCDIILHEAALDLLKPYGAVSLGNLNFLYAVYYNATKDTLNVLVNSNRSILEKNAIYSGSICKQIYEYSADLYS